MYILSDLSSCTNKSRVDFNFSFKYPELNADKCRPNIQMLTLNCRIKQYYLQSHAVIYLVTA